MENQKVDKLLPTWLWLWFPIALALFLLSLIVFYPHLIAPLINAEGGIVELATPLILLPAVISGVMSFRYISRLPARWLAGWIVIITAASLYFAGEELSWGQQLFHWDTPEAISELNDQDETNIHNISSWFDQKPRILLELWVLIGGVIIPLVYRYKSISLQVADWRYWFWPHINCMPAAVLAIVVKLPERYRDLGGELPYTLGLRYSEMQELFFAVFLALYLLSVYRKLSRPAALAAA